MYAQRAIIIGSKARLPWIDSLPYRVPWNGYNTVSSPQIVDLYIFFKCPSQTWIQAQMVQVMFKHHLGINPY